jgi:hypothetical protein
LPAVKYELKEKVKLKSVLVLLNYVCSYLKRRVYPLLIFLPKSFISCGIDATCCTGWMNSLDESLEIQNKKLTKKLVSLGIARGRFCCHLTYSKKMWHANCKLLNFPTKFIRGSEFSGTNLMD